MIAYLTGILFNKTPQSAILDVGGVGYQVFIPLSTFYQLPEEKEKVNLYIYTHIRQDILQLFGFLSEIEKKLFLLLISVTGIGPKLALGILSGIGIHDLIDAIICEDHEKIASAPGVGKKTSRRIVLELKDKAVSLYEEADIEPAKKVEIKNKEVFDDTLSALVNLGYPGKTAKKTIENILQKNDELDLTTLLKEALKDLAA